MQSPGCRKMVASLLLLTRCLPLVVSLSGLHSNSFDQIQTIVGKPPQKAAPITKRKVASQLDTSTTERVNAVPSPDDETVDTFIRSEYGTWTIANNKTSSEKRFEIFKGNFLDNLKKYEKTGRYSALNKFADMTPEEYKQEPAPVDEVDAYVRSEYKAWLVQYGKTPDKKRYTVFKDNFLMTMKSFEETGKFNALNEHGDMTREEFLSLQTNLALSSKSPTGGNGLNGQESGGGPYSTIPPQSASQASYPSYPRSSAMAFIPVSPGAQSDILNRGSSSGGGTSDWGVSSGGCVGSDWGATSGDGGWGAPSYTPSFAPSVHPPAASSPPVDQYSSYEFSRPSSMTFTPVTMRSQSDVLNKGSSSSSNDWGGQEWGSPVGGNRDTYSSMVGPQEPPAPAVGPPVSSPWGGPQQWSSPMPPASQPDPYSSYEFSRPSSMTFTPVTMLSQSDVLNNGSSSNRNGDWSGQDWGFTGGSSSSPSPPQQDWGFTGGSSSGPSPPQQDWGFTGGSSSNQTPPPVRQDWGSPPQAYSPTNPSGATFKSITPNSNSDILNRDSSEQNWKSGRPTSQTSSTSSNTYFQDKKGKSAFSYMPKSGGSPNHGRFKYNSGPPSPVGKPSAASPQGKKSNPSRGNSKSDSLWNKMASAFEALAGGGKPRSYSFLNNKISGNQKSNGTSKGNR